ncbi:MAG: DUF6113 family protein [Actinomycetales bacterium]|nr:DUF6113 family protein [Actinomycetales bacterium]
MPDDVTETPHPVVPGASPSVDGPALDPEPSPAGAPSHALTHAGLLLGGVVLGLVGTVLTAARAFVRGVTVPWGLVLVLVAVLACVRGAAWLVGSRRGAALVGLGWVLPTLAFATTNPGGDVLLPDVPRTYAYLGGAALIVVLAVALPLPRGTRELVASGRAPGAGQGPVQEP